MSQSTETQTQRTTDFPSLTSHDRVLSMCVIDASGTTIVEKVVVLSTSDGPEQVFEFMGWMISLMLETHSVSPRENWTASFYGSSDTLVLDFRGLNPGSDTGIVFSKTSPASWCSEMATLLGIDS